MKNLAKRIFYPMITSASCSSRTDEQEERR